MCARVINCVECGVSVKSEGAQRAILLLPCQHMIHFGCLEFIKHRAKIQEMLLDVAVSPEERNIINDDYCEWMEQEVLTVPSASFAHHIICPLCKTEVYRSIPLFTLVESVKSTDNSPQQTFKEDASKNDATLKNLDLCVDNDRSDENKVFASVKELQRRYTHQLHHLLKKRRTVAELGQCCATRHEQRMTLLRELDRYHRELPNLMHQHSSEMSTNNKQTSATSKLYSQNSEQIVKVSHHERNQNIGSCTNSMYNCISSSSSSLPLTRMNMPELELYLANSTPHLIQTQHELRQERNNLRKRHRKLDALKTRYLRLKSRMNAEMFNTVAKLKKLRRSQFKLKHSTEAQKLTPLETSLMESLALPQEEKEQELESTEESSHLLKESHEEKYPREENLMTAKAVAEPMNTPKNICTLEKSINTQTETTLVSSIDNLESTNNKDVVSTNTTEEYMFLETATTVEQDSCNLSKHNFCQNKSAPLETNVPESSVIMHEKLLNSEINKESQANLETYISRSIASGRGSNNNDDDDDDHTAVLYDVKRKREREFQKEKESFERASTRESIYINHEQDRIEAHSKSSSCIDTNLDTDYVNAIDVDHDEISQTIIYDVSDDTDSESMIDAREEHLQFVLCGKSDVNKDLPNMETKHSYSYNGSVDIGDTNSNDSTIHNCHTYAVCTTDRNYKNCVTNEMREVPQEMKRESYRVYNEMECEEYQSNEYKLCEERQKEEWSLKDEKNEKEIECYTNLLPAYSLKCNRAANRTSAQHLSSSNTRIIHTVLQNLPRREDRL